MPKVRKAKKSARGGEYSCVACTEKIVKGQEYYEWSFFRQRPRRQHTSHGMPKRSQLTQSNMSEAYAAEEGLAADIEAANTIDDIKTALSTCRDSIESVKEQYESGYDAMPQGLQDSDAGQESQRKIEALDEYINALDNAESDIEDFDEEEPDADSPEHQEWQDKHDAALEAAREKAQEPTLED